MPYDANKDDDRFGYGGPGSYDPNDPSNQGPAVPTTVGGGSGLVGQGVGANPNSGRAEAISTNAGGSSGSSDNAGRFVNFGRYFDLNRQKAKGVGAGIAGGIGAAGTAAQGALDTRVGAFNRGVTAGTPGSFDPNRSYPSAAPNAHFGVKESDGLGSTSTRPSGETPGTSVQESGGGLTPAEMVNRSQWTRPELEAGSTAGYTGPTGLGDTTDLAAQFGGVQDRARGLGKAGGVESELGRTYGAQGFNTTSSTGNSRLEAGLAGAAGQPELKAAQDRYSNFSDRLTAARNQANNDASVASDNAIANRARFAGGLKNFDIANARANPQAITIGAAPGVGTASSQLGSDSDTALIGNGIGDTQGNQEHAIARDLVASGLVPANSQDTSVVNGFFGFVRDHPEYAGITRNNGTSTATDQGLLTQAWAAYQAWMQSRKGG